MKEDLSQPFYVPIGKGKLNLHTGQRGGYYLPALEPKPDPCEAPEHDLEGLHERVLVLEERPQPIEKAVVRTTKTKQKPEPKLHGGVSL